MRASCAPKAFTVCLYDWLLVFGDNGTLSTLSISSGIAGGLLSPDGVGAVDPAQKLIGSMIIIYAESLDEARKIAESDVYWTGNVVRCSSVSTGFYFHAFCSVG